MSRYDAASDADYDDDLNGPYLTCTCVVCGQDFHDESPQTICVECADARDGQTDALEALLTEIALTAVKVALGRKEGAA